MATSSIETPIISNPHEPAFFFFSSEKAVGKRKKRRGGYGSDAVKSRDFLLMYPLLFCLFSVYFLFKKGCCEFCFIGGRVGRKKEKKGIAK